MAVAGTIIERVARAIAEAELGPMGEMEEYQWEKHHDTFLSQARAAIEAMREPTEKMVDAGQMPTYIWVDESADDVWTRMINAALSD